MKLKIEAALEEIRPRLALHGGNVEYVDFASDSGTLSVRLTGACKGCPMAKLTLKLGIEAYITERIPAVHSVVEIKE